MITTTCLVFMTALVLLSLIVGYYNGLVDGRVQGVRAGRQDEIKRVKEALLWKRLAK